MFYSLVPSFRFTPWPHQLASFPPIHNKFDPVPQRGENASIDALVADARGRIAGAKWLLNCPPRSRPAGGDANADDTDADLSPYPAVRAAAGAVEADCAESFTADAKALGTRLLQSMPGIGSAGAGVQARRGKAQPAVPASTTGASATATGILAGGDGGSGGGAVAGAPPPLAAHATPAVSLPEEVVAAVSAVQRLRRHVSARLATGGGTATAVASAPVAVPSLPSSVSAAPLATAASGANADRPLPVTASAVAAAAATTATPAAAAAAAAPSSSSAVTPVGSAVPSTPTVTAPAATPAAADAVSPARAGTTDPPPSAIRPASSAAGPSSSVKVHMGVYTPSAVATSVLGAIGCFAAAVFQGIDDPRGVNDAISKYQPNAAVTADLVAAPPPPRPAGNA